jgi:predicted RNA methylase
MTYTIETSSAALTTVAYFTKGLGDIALAEIRELAPEAQILDSDDRFAVVAVPAVGAGVLIDRSRTIDDLRVLVAGPAEVTTESDFAALVEQAESRAGDVIGTDRGSDEPWSVTVSARNPIWRRKPTWDPTGVLAKALHSADPAATSRQPVDLRLQIDGTTAHISLNLTSRPLGKPDTAVTRPGALRPTVAASLVRMAVAAVGPEVARKGLYDPFCGTGTIVDEAVRTGLPVFASDLDPEAVEITRQRLAQRAQGDAEDFVMHRVFVHDVLRGVPARGDVPLLASNLPWGKQVKIERRSELFDNVAAITVRSLHQGGAGVLLTTNEDQLAARISRHDRSTRIETRRIGLLGQTPGIVVASLP